MHVLEGQVHKQGLRQVVLPDNAFRLLTEAAMDQSAGRQTGIIEMHQTVALYVRLWRVGGWCGLWGRPLTCCHRRGVARRVGKGG